MIYIYALVFIFSLYALMWSSDKFVWGASHLGSHLKFSPALIGIILVGFGTSAPEIFVSIFSVMDGVSSLAVGNVLGSNIYNIGFVLAIVGFFYSFYLHSFLVKIDLLLLVFFTFLAGLLFIDGMLSFLDGVLLLSVFSGYLLFNLYRAKKKQIVVDLELSDTLSYGLSIVWFLVGLGLVLVFSKLLVFCAMYIATYFGFSDLLIGLTIVALGTSLPELAATFSAVRHSHYDIAFGNIIGSCFFNLFLVLGLIAILDPIKIDLLVLHRDFLFVFLLPLVLFVFLSFNLKKNLHVLSRLCALVLFFMVFVYIYLLI